MGYFGELYYGENNRQFIGKPIEDIKETSKELYNRYQTARQADNEMKLMMDKVKVLSPFQEGVNNAIKSYKEDMSDIYTVGNYEDAANNIQDGYLKFATNQRVKNGIEATNQMNSYMAELYNNKSANDEGYDYDNLAHNNSNDSPNVSKSNRKTQNSKLPIDMADVFANHASTTLKEYYEVGGVETEYTPEVEGKGKWKWKADIIHPADYVNAQELGNEFLKGWAESADSLSKGYITTNKTEGYKEITTANGQRVYADEREIAKALQDYYTNNDKIQDWYKTVANYENIKLGKLDRSQLEASLIEASDEFMKPYNKVVQDGKTTKTVTINPTRQEAIDKLLANNNYKGELISNIDDNTIKSIIVGNKVNNRYQKDIESLVLKYGFKKDNMNIDKSISWTPDRTGDNKSTSPIYDQYNISNIVESGTPEEMQTLADNVATTQTKVQDATNKYNIANAKLLSNPNDAIAIRERDVAYRDMMQGNETINNYKRNIQNLTNQSQTVDEYNKVLDKDNDLKTVNDALITAKFNAEHPEYRNLFNSYFKANKGNLIKTINDIKNNHSNIASNVQQQFEQIKADVRSDMVIGGNVVERYKQYDPNIENDILTSINAEIYDYSSQLPITDINKVKFDKFKTDIPSLYNSVDEVAEVWTTPDKNTNLGKLTTSLENLVNNDPSSWTVRSRTGNTIKLQDHIATLNDNTYYILDDKKGYIKSKIGSNNNSIAFNSKPRTDGKIYQQITFNSEDGKPIYEKVDNRCRRVTATIAPDRNDIITSSAKVLGEERYSAYLNPPKYYTPEDINKSKEEAITLLSHADYSNLYNYNPLSVKEGDVSIGYNIGTPDAPRYVMFKTVSDNDSRGFQVYSTTVKNNNDGSPYREPVTNIYPNRVFKSMDEYTRLLTESKLIPKSN